MVIVRVKGTITESGEIKVDLPEGWQPGEIEVALPVAGSDEAPFTEAELDELMRSEPKTGAEIVASGLVGGWESKEITDGVEFVEALRRRRRERSQWQSD